jgi:glycosyltransferase involved in cell wall biosynthesis
MRAHPIAAIVLTLNEEKHLGECLESLQALQARVIVLDSGSIDRTVEIAACHGAEFIHSPFEGFASQRNKALDLAASSPWVLFIDADERLSTEGIEEIRSRIEAEDDDIAGFWFPRRNIVFGRELSGGGWWPDYQARLIRSGRGRYDAQREVHEVVMFDGRTEKLSQPLLHINYESRREFLQRQRAYTIRSARAGLIPAPRPHSYLSRPAREFLRRFVGLRGYRDGSTGLFMAAVMALEELRGCFLSRQTRRS